MRIVRYVAIPIWFEYVFISFVFSSLKDPAMIYKIFNCNKCEEGVNAMYIFPAYNLDGTTCPCPELIIQNMMQLFALIFY